jgi:hypothetical protein
MMFLESCSSVVPSLFMILASAVGSSRPEIDGENVTLITIITLNPEPYKP